MYLCKSKEFEHHFLSIKAPSITSKGKNCLTNYQEQIVRNTEELYASNKELQSPQDDEEREAGLEPPILQEEIIAAMKQLSNKKPPCV